MMPTIIKADGTTESFDPARLTASLRRAGAAPYTAERITETITASVVPGASSKEVYARAFVLLRKEARPLAARYALRRALLELGPTGHPFEDFISHLFKKEGWRVETRKTIQGTCVAHEVDFYASHEERREYLAAELKYHNDPGYKTDLKTALYVKARFEDIFSCDPKTRACPIDRGLLVTNTKFTTEAIRYASCAVIELLGWSYPAESSLLDHMYRARVYPITTLTTLARAQKNLLLNSGLVAVDELLADRTSLDPLRLAPQDVGEIFAEAEALLALPHISHDA
ncbi:ATP-binding protein [Candidatus Kaiserbacteria bacterium]|nr:ATP-binding protein [Candidatus Kaiserbacteria bacterium]